MLTLRRRRCNVNCLLPGWKSVRYRTKLNGDVQQAGYQQENSLAEQPICKERLYR